MDWLSQTTCFLPSDLALFKFCPGDSFQIQTISLIVENLNVKYTAKRLYSEKEYLDWIEECQAYLQGGTPVLLIVIHLRHEPVGGLDAEAIRVPYSRDTFEYVSKRMYQHRSMALSLPRYSTTIFNTKHVKWTYQGSKETSIVYNCRSDTEKLPRKDDIIQSTTYFTSKPWTFSIIYGSSPELTAELTSSLRRFRRSAFHPLMIPMMFVEHERKRFLRSLSVNGPKMTQMIVDLELRLEDDIPRRRKSDRNWNRCMTEKDCDGTRVWAEVSAQKIGLESLKHVLGSLEQQSQEFRELELRAGKDGTNETITDSISQENIRCRLQEMTAELDTQIRTCEGLLTGMSLAIQVEWNYHARRDAEANITIAKASKEDSTRMRMISLVGMVFLPGTFLATLFSMSFFQWIPDDSTQVVSPWIAIYFGLTAIATGATWWRWRTWPGDSDPKSNGPTDSVIDYGDAEKGSLYTDNFRLSRSSDNKEPPRAGELEMVIVQ